MKFNVLRISEDHRPSKKIGTIEWTPQDWSYKTDDAELLILLDEAKTFDTATVYTAVDVEDTTYDFVEEEVDSSDFKFVSGLQTLLESDSEDSAIWLDMSNPKE